MPDLRTEITEIITGLGSLGLPTLQAALDARPAQMVNVQSSHWRRLSQALSSGRFYSEFCDSWRNGEAFLYATEGLRGRIPRRVEWKGPHRPPGYDLLPADLRIDHVFLVSCKNLSKVLMNVAPPHLFDRQLAVRWTSSRIDWYAEVAPDAYSSFYSQVRDDLLGAHRLRLPSDMTALTPAGRRAIASFCARVWPRGLERSYGIFAQVVAERTADRWRANLSTTAEQEAMLWRLLRFETAPYFILGVSANGPMRLRIATPWEWKQEFQLTNFEVFPQPLAQPRVGWTARMIERSSGSFREVEGHVEIRWSHGRFCGFPEAKVYLDTPHEDVPGYFSLT